MSRVAFAHLPWPRLGVGWSDLLIYVPPCLYDAGKVKEHNGILQTEVNPVLVGDNTNKGGKVKEHNGILQTEANPVLVGDNTNKGGVSSFKGKATCERTDKSENL